VAAIIEAYFDESSSEDDHTLLAVSGYIFDKDRCLSLDAAWQKMLENYGLPYFRMSACAHGNSPFDKLSAPQRDEAARRALAIIKEHMLFGFSSSVREKDYTAWMPPRNTVGSAYVWCCWNSLIGVRIWAEKNRFGGRIAYFFEAGHKHQTEANGVMNRIFNDADFRQRYRYASHAFVPKEYNRPVQTADILAWHHVQDFRRYLDGRPRRRDFEALLEGQQDQYSVVHGRREMFEGLPEVAALRDLVEQRKRQEQGRALATSAEPIPPAPSSRHPARPSARHSRAACMVLASVVQWIKGVATRLLGGHRPPS
jgi:hypothetical protein